VVEVVVKLATGVPKVFSFYPKGILLAQEAKSVVGVLEVEPIVDFLRSSSSFLIAIELVGLQ
jgi:hypothetical protein